LLSSGALRIKHAQTIEAAEHGFQVGRKERFFRKAAPRARSAIAWSGVEVINTKKGLRFSRLNSAIVSRPLKPGML